MYIHKRYMVYCHLRLLEGILRAQVDAVELNTGGKPLRMRIDKLLGPRHKNCLAVSPFVCYVYTFLPRG